MGGLVKRPLRFQPRDLRELDSLIRSLEANLEATDITLDALSVLARASATSGVAASLSASANDQLLLRRSNALVFGTLVDADIPITIARDTEVAQAIVDHEAEADPHSVYPLRTDFDAFNYAISNDTTDRTFDANRAAGAISSPPTQAEVENIRDAVLELADVVATIIKDLR